EKNAIPTASPHGIDKVPGRESVGSIGGVGGRFVADFRGMITFVVAVLALAGLAACGSKHGSGNSMAAAPPSALFPDDFKGVCSGAPLAAATAYDPHAPTHHALFFASNSAGDDLLDQSLSLPHDWTVHYAEGQDTYKPVDLIV